MEDIVICSESEGINTEERNNQSEQAILGKPAGSPLDRLRAAKDPSILIETVEVSGEFGYYKGKRNKDRGAHSHNSLGNLTE